LSHEVAIVIDERDQAALDDQEGEKDNEGDAAVAIEHVQVSKRVRRIPLCEKNTIFLTSPDSRYACALSITIKAKKPR
jgi:hypothetical protein